MDLSNHFHRQLTVSAEGFVWVVKQVPSERQYRLPPLPLGTWSAARHAFHLLHYEQTIGLPSMRQWLGFSEPATIGLSEDASSERGPAGGSDPPLSDLLSDLESVRDRQVKLLVDLDAVTWECEQSTIWGRKSLLWVVTKTFQYTAEHTHDVLSIALYWDLIA